MGNHASRKVSEREGMRLVETQQGNFVSGPLLKEIWEMTQEEWLKRKATLEPRQLD